MLAYLASRLTARGADRGATAAEYGLLVALVAIVTIGAVFLLGNNLDAAFGGLDTTIELPAGP